MVAVHSNNWNSI